MFGTGKSSPAMGVKGVTTHSLSGMKDAECIPLGRNSSVIRNEGTTELFCQPTKCSDRGEDCMSESEVGRKRISSAALAVLSSPTSLPKRHNECHPYIDDKKNI
jgi:hypothetical protein